MQPEAVKTIQHRIIGLVCTINARAMSRLPLTASRQMLIDRIFAAHLTGVAHGHEDTNTIETPTLDALRAQVEASDRWYVDYSGSLAPALLSEVITFRFTDGGSGRMTREEMLIHVALHGGYHRGAIGRILAQLSIAPPRDIYTGYLHKAEPARRGQA